jgi:DNA polymerase III sliding clamp (beta) subunit (PCNA family)
MVINNKKLQEGLKIAKGFISTKNTISLLSNIKVSIQDGNILTFNAHNSTFSVMVECEAEPGEGAFLVPVDKIPMLKSDNIEVGDDFVKSGEIKYLVGKNTMQEFNDLKSVDVDSPVYKCVVEPKQMKLVYAVSSKTLGNRRFLQGFLVKSNGEIVSTDGKRMAVYTTGIAGEREIEAIIPFEAIKYLTGKALVSLQGEGREVLWKIEYYNKDFLVTLCGKTVEGSFPPYERVIPALEKLIHSVNWTKSDWAEKYKRFKPLLHKDNKKLLITEDSKVFVENLVIGSYEEALPFAYPFKQGLNADFLNDWFSIMGDAQIELQERESDSLVISTGNVKYIIMPMSVN